MISPATPGILPSMSAPEITPATSGAESSVSVARIDPALLAALCLALAYHGVLLVAGSYTRTYDAYVHIFLADHYVRSWWDVWEPRWYTGFNVTSYPPGAQQSIALVASAVGETGGFVVVQLLAILLVTIGVYRFSRLWVSDEAAGYAAVFAVFCTSWAETIHVFGQLPTMFSLGFLLNALPFLDRWLRRGEWPMLFVTLAVFAACTAGHHVTTLFGSVFFAGPVIAAAILGRFRTPHPDEAATRPARVTGRNVRPLILRRLRRIVPVIFRGGVFGLALIVVLLGVVLPYWLWSASDPISQVSIPHASRDNYLINRNAGLVFWLVPWGLSLLALPYAAYKGLTTKALPLAASLALLTFLGTGGTTPYPKILLGPAFEILTLDRFTFWATIAILPFVGAFIVSLRHGGIARFLRVQFGDLTWRATQAALIVLVLLASVAVSNLTHFRKFQPAAIDMQPIVTFLSKDQHDRWRYLTLGFGDQLAWLSAQTTATTPDGNYHSARRLPELTSTPIERLEGAKYSGMPGIGSLQQFLAVPEKYNLKYVFCNDQFYDPVLFFSGWNRIGRLENGITVWERADIPQLPAALPRKETPRYQTLMWGTIPMTAILVALAVMAVLLAGWLAAPRLDWANPARLPIPGTRIASRVWTVIDARLERWSRPPDETVSAPRAWQWWTGWISRLPRPTAPSRRSRLIRLATIAFLVVIAAGLAGKAIARPVSTPRQTIEAYWDDLDFRRFGDAWNRLDPETRPPYQQFVLDQTSRGGLLASYAKLDAVRPRLTLLERDNAEATVETEWVTSIKRYRFSEEVALARRAGVWYLVPEDQVLATPPDQFLREPGIEWFQQERPRIDPGPADFPVVADRPELQIAGARLVRNGDAYSVVGEVTNIDADPADLTVTAIVYDADGRVLTWYNAQTAVSHKLLPGATTPFRVDFEGIAGVGNTPIVGAIPFEPGQRFALPRDLWDRAARFDVFARAEVASRDLAAAVGMQRLTVGENGAISGTLINNGTVEAIIPHLLVTYYDANGAVAWVDQVFLDQSIRPQRELAFAIPAANPDAIARVMDQGGAYANTLSSDRATGALLERLPMPEASGFACARVSIDYLVPAQ